MKLLAKILVKGAAVPWSTPEHFLGKSWKGKPQWVHKKDPRLCAWQDAIRAEATRAYTGEPYPGPVRLETTFFKGTEDQDIWGDFWWSETPKAGHGDATNLLKAAEDSVTTYLVYKGTGKARKLLLKLPLVIANDSQVCFQRNLKLYGPMDAALIQVYAIEEED